MEQSFCLSRELVGRDSLEQFSTSSMYKSSPFVRSSYKVGDEEPYILVGDRAAMSSVEGETLGGEREWISNDPKPLDRGVSCNKEEQDFLRWPII